MTDAVVTRNDSKGRYEARVDGELAGFTEFRLRDGVVVFPHTVVFPEHEGQGIGSSLARTGLDDVRSRGLSVIATCPFIHGWILRHPDYLDLLYSGRPVEDEDRAEQD